MLPKTGIGKSALICDVSRRIVEKTKIIAVGALDFTGDQDSITFQAFNSGSHVFKIVNYTGRWSTYWAELRDDTGATYKIIDDINTSPAIRRNAYLLAEG